MTDRTRLDWEDLGRREPYFGVLTEERFRRENLGPDALRDFFASGEAEVEHLFRVIQGAMGESFAPRSALDFGCGVGRLTMPLARRVPDVLAIDVAQSMLDLAGEHCRKAGLDNVRFRLNHDELASLEPESFDLVCSLIVLQHVPVKQGERLLARLLQATRPGGVAVLHLTFHRPGGRLRRLARAARARLPLLHRVAAAFEGRRAPLPYMQMNEYDLNRTFALLSTLGFRRAVVEMTDHGGILGARIVAERGSAGH
jgi:SAM-dependent methyltransferase